MSDLWSAAQMEEPGRKGVLFAPNESYRPSHLSKEERAWVRAIKALEKARKNKKK